MSRQKLKLRSFRRGDEQLFKALVNTTYRNLETLTEERVKTLTSPPYFNPKGFFIAEKQDADAPVGCVGVFNLSAEKCFTLQYLAVRQAMSNLHVVNSLIEAALKYSASRKPKLLKAVTLTVQPYVDAYQLFGFKPVRRILRIAWDLTKIPREKRPRVKTIVAEVSQDEVEEASVVFVEGLRLYWDWYIEEGGGTRALQKMVADWMEKTTYLGAKVNDKIVGVAAVIPRAEGSEAAFSGVIVLPEFRMKRIGSALLSASLHRANQLGCKRLVVHTMAYLNSLTPGAVLYLKSGGRIEAEYLQLVREVNQRIAKN